MVEDLSKHHGTVGNLLTQDSASEDVERYRLSEEQVEFFRENGYLKGIRVLSDEQVETLRGELEQLMNPAHEGRHLFHEYHSNESSDPNRVLFHALGAWRVTPGFHDLLCIRRLRRRMREESRRGTWSLEWKGGEFGRRM